MVNLVYIAHPVGGDIKENIKKIISICHDIHREDNNVIPFAPYILALQYLDDDISEDRNLGIESNIEHFKRNNFDELWLCGPRVSAGMEIEVKASFKHGIPVKCYNPSLQSRLDEIRSDFDKEKN